MLPRSLWRETLPNLVASLLATALLSIIVAISGVFGVPPALDDPHTQALIGILAFLAVLGGTVYIFRARTKSLIVPGSRVARFGRTAKALSLAALIASGLLPAGLYLIHTPSIITLRLREFYRERFLDADVFHFSFRSGD